MLTKKQLYILILLLVFIFCNKNKDTNQNKELSNNVSLQVEQLLKQGAIVIDVRTKEEFDLAHYKDALHIPYDQIENHIKELEKYKNQPVILYCRSGRRAGIAKQILEQHGFTNVINAINLDSFPKDKVVP
ncbi:MAG: hypothetical protein KatS3mg129_1534 [Leptospiraceae bacterium]|nr:MAG: hypothetical protein KatS3mg129_1534 [Leptospiraceae bacterium]